MSNLDIHMGVTYKLKQEVIDLIVQKKQADPSLSCRKLVCILRDVFHLHVSKSSINGVIKDFKLSNPVGRRSSKAPKNFIIPSNKKQQLFDQVVPFLPVISENVESVEEVTQSVLINEEANVEAVHLAPDLLQAEVVAFKEFCKAEIDWSDDKGPLL